MKTPNSFETSVDREGNEPTDLASLCLIFIFDLFSQEKCHINTNLLPLLKLWI
jgi:hypothetical protein